MDSPAFVPSSSPGISTFLSLFASMPRAKAGVHLMRVGHGDVVHILAHRLPFVAWRAHRWNASKRLALLQQLQAQEQLHCTYRAVTCFHTGISGLLTLRDSAGTCYSAHHTDVVRA